MALSRLVEYLKTTDEPHSISEEKLQLLKDVDAALDRHISEEQAAPSVDQPIVPIKKTAGVYSGDPKDYPLSR